MKWISVEDEMPEISARKFVRVLVCQEFYDDYYNPPKLKEKRIVIAWTEPVTHGWPMRHYEKLNRPLIHFSCESYSSCGIEGLVTHWMPLPNPPEDS